MEIARNTAATAIASFPRDEALQIGTLLAFIGGYPEAYTWIVHHVFANAQSANLVFLWVYMTSGDWQAAGRYVPPLLAFAVGVVLACWLRWAKPQRATRVALLVIVLLLCEQKSPLLRQREGGLI